MALTAGSRLGPYEILSALRSGGMGEAYRAQDSKLKRKVVRARRIRGCSGLDPARCQKTVDAEPRVLRGRVRASRPLPFRRE
jgi:hypothetical protein